jgi:hypothetical protein
MLDYEGGDTVHDYLSGFHLKPTSNDDSPCQMLAHMRLTDHLARAMQEIPPSGEEEPGETPVSSVTVALSGTGLAIPRVSSGSKKGYGCREEDCGTNAICR